MFISRGLVHRARACLRAVWQVLIWSAQLITARFCVGGFFNFCKIDILCDLLCSGNTILLYFGNTYHLQWLNITEVHIVRDLSLCSLHVCMRLFLFIRILFVFYLLDAIFHVASCALHVCINKTKKNHYLNPTLKSVEYCAAKEGWGHILRPLHITRTHPFFKNIN